MKYTIITTKGKEEIDGNIYTLKLSNGETVEVGVEGFYADGFGVTDIKSGLVIAVMEYENLAIEEAKRKLEFVISHYKTTIEEFRKKALKEKEKIIIGRLK